jgi:hypothetical protein
MAQMVQMVQVVREQWVEWEAQQLLGAPVVLDMVADLSDGITLLEQLVMRSREVI